MQKKFIIFTFLSVFFLLSFSPSIFALNIPPDFQEELLAAKADDYYGAIVAMKDKLDPLALEQTLLKPVRYNRAERHYRIVTTLQEKAHKTQGSILEYLNTLQQSGDVQEYRSHWIANLVYVKAKPQVLFDVAQRNDVEVVYKDYPIELIAPVETMPSENSVIAGAEQGLRDIKANQLWKKGYRGEGVLVSHLDTGVDGNHVALASRWRGLQPGVTPAESFFDPVTNRTFPFDSGSHGTHTMGTICGVTPGDTIGVAPAATWITAAVIDRVSIPRTVSDAILAFQWTADPDGDPQTVDDVPVTSSNSWGLSPFYHGYPKCDNTFWAVLDGCEAAGVAVVFAAGNEGYYGAESLRTPGDRNTTETNVFSVGALQPGSQYIASFSSLGPSGCDHQTKKPEVCAQGENVRSSVPGNQYSYYSGTSMATPHIAGAIALLMQVDSDQTSTEVKEALYKTCDDLGTTGNDNTYGWGRINLLSAYNYIVSYFGNVQGKVSDKNSGDGLPALVEVVGTAFKTTANSNGQYTLKLPGETTYTLRASYYGYVTSEKSIFVPKEQTVTLNFPLDKEPTGTLGGKIRDSYGLPVADATVTLVGTPETPKVTDYKGDYSFGTIPGAKNYTVATEKCEYVNASKQIYVVPDQFNRCDIQMAANKPDNMENGENGWIHYVVTTDYVDEWHIDNYKNHTSGGKFSWKAGGNGGYSYSNLSDGGLVTHCINLPDGAIMKFWHWIYAEVYSSTQAWDGGIVEISTDGGANFKQITPQGGYTHTIRQSPTSPFPAGTPCYSGLYDFRQASFDLSAYSGEVYIRFRFGSNATGTATGWFIDDLTFEKPAPDVDIWVSDTPASVQPGTTMSWKIHYDNNLSTPKVVDYWLIIASSALPSKQSPMFKLIKSNVTLPANSTGTRTMQLAIPSTAPTGTYYFMNVVGDYPNVILDSDQFSTVITPVDGSGDKNVNIQNSGDFEVYFSE